MDFKVICLSTPTFYDLLDKVYGYYNEKDNRKEDQWISREEVMYLFRTTSDTTMQIKDEGRFVTFILLKRCLKIIHVKRTLRKIKEDI